MLFAYRGFISVIIVCVVHLILIYKCSEWNQEIMTKLVSDSEYILNKRIFMTRNVKALSTFSLSLNYLFRVESLPSFVNLATGSPSVSLILYKEMLVEHINI